MTFIDLVVVIALILFIVFGIKAGLLRGVLSFISTFVALILSVLLARPVAGLLDNWFDLADSLSALFTGSGPLDNIARSNGMLLLIILVGIALFIATKISVFFLKRLAKRLTESNPTINTVDRVLGLGFGIFRFCLWAFSLGTIIFVLSAMNAFSGIEDWIFTDSTLARWIYDRVVDLAIPLLRSIGAGGIIS